MTLFDGRLIEEREIKHYSTECKQELCEECDDEECRHICHGPDDGDDEDVVA